MSCGCEGGRSGRVWFRYGGGDWDNVVSRQPPICWECEPIDGGGQGECVLYTMHVTVVQSTGVTLPGQPWWIQECQEREFETHFPLRGPITNVRLVEPDVARCDGRTPVWNAIAATHRGGFNDTCLPPRDEVLNRLFQILRIRVRFERADGQPDTGGGNRFSVYDGSGTLYSRTAPTCPEVRISCDEECPPGTDPLCTDCCCDCTPLIAEARSIQSLLRNMING